MNFGHTENREGYNTQGTYYVNLPDGRLQTVNYHADEAGYVADVQYTGTAVVPAYAPAPVGPAYAPVVPAYASAPVVTAYGVTSIAGPAFIP